jgi:hypothetical protein
MANPDTEERTIALASLSKESRLARDERKLGIVITRIPCPLLLVTGSAENAWPEKSIRTFGWNTPKSKWRGPLIGVWS